MRIENAHPRVTADLIINFKDQGIVLIRRKYPPFESFWALPGGHLEVGKEDIYETALREASEETNLSLSRDAIHLLGVYSGPDRDPRGHYLTVAFYGTVLYGKPQARDDARELGVFSIYNLPPVLAFDHQQILADYIKATNRLILPERVKV